MRQLVATKILKSETNHGCRLFGDRWLAREIATGAKHHRRGLHSGIPPVHFAQQRECNSFESAASPPTRYCIPCDVTTLAQWHHSPSCCCSRNRLKSSSPSRLVESSVHFPASLENVPRTGLQEVPQEEHILLCPLSSIPGTLPRRQNLSIMGSTNPPSESGKICSQCLSLSPSLFPHPSPSSG